MPRKPKNGGHSDEFIIKTYQEIGEIVKTAKLLKICHKELKKVLIANNIETNTWVQYNVDEAFFEKIDTKEKAYFLGFLWTDGNNTRNVKTQHYNIALCLSEKDKYILEKFKSMIGYTGPLHFVKGGPRVIMGYNCEVKNQYSLRICSKKISDDLNKIGMTANKTDTLELPSFNIVPENLYRHFIRGVFDGDGCLTKQKENNSHVFAICMKNFKFAEQFIFIIKKFLEILYRRGSHQLS